MSDDGGRDAGPLLREEHELSLYEKRVDALLALVSRTDICAESHRRAQEMLSPEEDDRRRYYDRWVEALRGILVDAGLLTEAEIEARLTVLRREPGT